MFHISMFAFLSILIISVIKPDCRDFKWNSNVFIWLSVFIGLALLVSFIWFLNQIDFLELLRTDKMDKQWGTIGSMAAGCFTGMAAFFTLATLLYTKRQNDKLMKERRNELQLTTFNISAEHKVHFFSMLGAMEKTYEISFLDKLGLYQELFPTNSIHSVSTKLTEEELSTTGVGKSIVKLQNTLSILRKLDNDPYRLHVKQTAEFDEEYYFTLDIVNCYRLIGINPEINPNKSTINYVIGCYEDRYHQATFINLLDLGTIIKTLSSIHGQFLRFFDLERLALMEDEDDVIFSNPCTIYGAILVSDLEANSFRSRHHSYFSVGFIKEIIEIYSRAFSECKSLMLDEHDVEKKKMLSHILKSLYLPPLSSQSGEIHNILLKRLEEVRSSMDDKINKCKFDELTEFYQRLNKAIVCKAA